MLEHVTRSVLVPFLDERTYVQGSTLFNVVAPFLSDARAVSFKISKIIRSNNLYLTYMQLPKVGSMPCAAECSWTDGRGDHIIYFRESGRIDSIKQTHDENAILRGSSVGSFAAVDLQPPYTFVETAVALNKSYLQFQLPLDAAHQFWFTRLDLVCGPPVWGSMELVYERAIGAVHHVTRIAVAGSRIGSIYFAKGRRDGAVS